MIVTTIIGYSVTAILIILMLTIIIIQNILNNQKILNPFLRFICRIIPLSFGVIIKVVNREELLKDRPYIFVANHVNIFDGFILYGHIPHFVRGIELEDHFSWPIWGAITRKLGNIPISHKNHRRAINSLKTASETIKKGTSLIILPEGHRTRTGRLQSFMRGPFRLAIETKADIVPIVMKNAFARKSVHSKIVTPGIVELVFGRPVPFDNFKNKTDRELKEHIKGILSKMLK